MALKLLGRLLVEEQIITEEQLDAALAEQRRSGELVGEVLVRQGAISEEALYRFVAIQHGLEFASLEGAAPAPELLRLVPPQVAWRYKAVPLARDNGQLVVATAAPDDLSLFYLPKELKLPQETAVRFVVSSPAQIRDFLERHFPQGQAGAGQGEVRVSEEAAPEAPASDPDQINLLESAEQEMLNPEDVDLEVLADRTGEEEDEEVRDEGPVIKLCNFIIADAVRKRASDIHLTPYEKQLILRYRIDGSLIEFKPPPAAMKRRIAARFKIMATLNLIEKRRPQDGRIHTTVDGRAIDVRISTLPTRWGENIVMRIVDQRAAKLDLDALGFEPDQLEQFKRAVASPYGMVFVTGPTGSGKTSTLFAALNFVNTPTKNIVTVEDPVEFRLPHIVQIQVDPAAGRTFASVLRSFLRHDPNIMLVGETRDPETAKIALQAAMTGHLVLSSLHTNDAPTSIMRLVDLEVDPIYIGASVLAIASQKLLRRVCESCKEPVAPSSAELARVGLTAEQAAESTFFRGRGCPACHQTGYKGRLAVYEVMPISASVRQVIFERGSLGQLRSAMREAGFKSLREAALLKWRRGQTTLEEVLGETFE